MIYSIYEEFLPDLEKRLKRINKKCTKNGNPFLYQIKGVEYKERKENGKTVRYKFCIIEVEGTAKIDNWECIATLERHENGNIIKNINNDISIPEWFYNSDNICEHCNTRRKRNFLYIIHNIKTDEYKQVGKNCLMEYTGGLNAEYVAGYLDGITELEKLNGCFGTKGTVYYAIKDVLAYAVEIIDKTGYFSSNSYVPTKDAVYNMLCRERLSFHERLRLTNRRLKEHHYDVFLEESDFHKAETAERVEKIIEYYKNIPEEDETTFIHNVKVLLAEEYVTYHNLGYIVYLPEGYNRYLKIEKKKAAKIKADKISEYFGEENKRYKNVPAILFDNVFTFETQWGINHIFKIVLKEGNVLIWKTSLSEIEMIANDTKKDFEDIDMENYVIDTISFTVKKHSLYKGIKQTEITRVVTHWKDRTKKTS